MKISLKKLIVFSCCSLTLMTTTAFAVSSMTYDGQGIRGKRSISRIVVNSGINVSHTNVSWSVPSTSFQQLDIAAHRDVWWGWSQEGTYSTYRTGTTNFSFNEIPSGTYSLYFSVPNSTATADIKGTASGF